MTIPIEIEAPRESRRRSIVKAVSYRLLGTAVTAATALAVTGQWSVAAGVGVVDLFGKVAVYYVHERVWERIPFGREKPPEYSI